MLPQPYLVLVRFTIYSVEYLDTGDDSGIQCLGVWQYVVLVTCSRPVFRTFSLEILPHFAPF
jgi:hypothetical protein